MLAVVESHPVQYRAPVYRALQASRGIDVTVIYRSEFSVRGYRDREFEHAFSWDTDLLSGYRAIFLTGSLAAEHANKNGWTLRAVGKALREAGPMVVLLVGYRSMLDMAGYWHARRLGVPIFLRAETTDHARRRNLLKTVVRSSILRRVYRGCARLLYIGKRSREHFLRLDVPESRLEFSPYCVSVEQMQASEDRRSALRKRARDELGIEPARNVFLFSGKLVPRKGPDLLLAAVRQLPDDVRSRTTLVFMGSGQMETELAALARQAPDIDVRFAGFKNQTELSPYYHACDLLVLPSLHSETWGLVVNEALHHGLPCVVSDAVGCADDLVEPGVSGETFETGSARSLANAVVRAQALIGRADVRKQCRTIVSRYTVNEAAAGIARAYRAVVAS